MKYNGININYVIRNVIASLLILGAIFAFPISQLMQTGEKQQGASIFLVFCIVYFNAFAFVFGIVMALLTALKKVSSFHFLSIFSLVSNFALTLFYILCMLMPGLETFVYYLAGFTFALLVFQCILAQRALKALQFSYHGKEDINLLTSHKTNTPSQ
jgi:hypothetical protein